MAAINTQGLTKEDVIENFFYLNMGAYGSAKTIYREMKKLGLAGAGSNPNITIQDVNDVLERQLVNQVFDTNNVHRDDYDTISAKFRGHSYQFDLMDMSNLKSDNAIGNNPRTAYRWVALIQDVYSRFIWAYPLRSKEAPAIKRTLERFNEDRKALQLPLLNFTSDGESGLLSNTVLQYLKNEITQPPERPPTLWVNKDRELGKFRTYMVERAIRQIREMLRGAFQLQQDFNWAWPPGAARSVAAATALDNARSAGTLIRTIIDQKNNLDHSSLGNAEWSEQNNGVSPTPFNILMDPTLEPMYAERERLFGKCTDGAACPSVQRLSRRRDITDVFKVGDIVRYAKTIKVGFQHPTQAKFWSRNLFEIIEVTPNDQGLANFIMGYDNPFEQKPGKGRRFTLRNINDDDDVRYKLYHELQLVPANTRVVPRGKTEASDLFSLNADRPVEPVAETIDFTKPSSIGKRISKKRLRELNAAARDLAAEDIDDTEEFAEAPANVPPPTARPRRQPQRDQPRPAPTRAPRPRRLTKAQRLQPGVRVSVKYPQGDFDGVVTKVLKSKPGIDVKFDDGGETARIPKAQYSLVTVLGQ